MRDILERRGEKAMVTVWASGVPSVSFVVTRRIPERHGNTYKPLLVGGGCRKHGGDSQLLPDFGSHKAVPAFLIRQWFDCVPEITTPLPVVERRPPFRFS